MNDWLAFARGKEIVRRPHYVIKGGRHRGHIIDTLAWDEEMVERVLQSGAMGMKTYPIRVTRDGKPVKGYVGISIHGVGGSFDAERSGAKYSGQEIIGYRRVIMREEEWDGSDVFLIPGLGIGTYVTQCVVSALEDLKLRNVSITANDMTSLP